MKIKSLPKTNSLMPLPPNEWTQLIKKQASTLSVLYKQENSFLKVREVDESGMESTKLHMRLTTGK